jgi:hypothetical protein
MQTLRRELRLKFLDILEGNGIYGSEDLSNKLVDAALEVKGISKVNPGTDWLIAGGVSSEEIARLHEEELAAKEKLDHYEREMVYNPLPWTDKKLERLARFLKKQTLEDIHRFAVWSKREYSSFSPAKARQFPEQVIELWPQACPKVVERPIQKTVEKEDETKYVVNLKASREKWEKEHGK